MTIIGDPEDINGMDEYKVPMIETDGCNYTEETIPLVEYCPMVRERIPNPFAHGNPKVAHFIQIKNFLPGMGLGKNQDVMQELIEIKGQKDGAGLRYGSTKGNHQGSSQHVGPLDRSARLGVEPPDQELQTEANTDVPDDTLLEGFSSLFLNESQPFICAISEIPPPPPNSIHPISEEEEGLTPTIQIIKLGQVRFFLSI